jgi:hypothetical protein
MLAIKGFKMLVEWRIQPGSGLCKDEPEDVSVVAFAIEDFTKIGGHLYIYMRT